jgi:hypothetical protein
MSDEEELSRELNWIDPDPQRDRRIFKTRPSGVNAMNAIAAIFWLIGIALGLAYVERVTGAGAVAFCLVAGLLAILSVALSRRLWIGMGSTLRSLLRPFGLLGPLPLLVLLGFSLLVGLNLWKRGFNPSPKQATSPQAAKAVAIPPPAPPPPPPPPPKMRTLKLVGKARKPEVTSRCAAEGPGWALATNSELQRTYEAIDSGKLNLNEVGYIWSNYGDVGPLYAHPINCHRSGCTIDVRTMYSGAAWVLCARDDPS